MRGQDKNEIRLNRCQEHHMTVTAPRTALGTTWLHTSRNNKNRASSKRHKPCDHNNTNHWRSMHEPSIIQHLLPSTRCKNKKKNKVRPLHEARALSVNRLNRCTTRPDRKNRPVHHHHPTDRMGRHQNNAQQRRRSNSCPQNQTRRPQAPTKLRPAPSSHQ